MGLVKGSVLSPCLVHNFWRDVIFQLQFEVAYIEMDFAPLTQRLQQNAMEHVICIKIH